MQGDIGNDYLESYTHEKVCFVVGAEFGPLSSHTMVIVKALYGLCSSGLHFHKKLADTLCTMDFFQSYANPDVWMCPPSTTDLLVPYDHVVVYVDDLFAAMTNPQEFFDVLQAPHGTTN